MDFSANLIFVDGKNSDNSIAAIRAINQWDLLAAGAHVSRNFGHKLVTAVGLDLGNGYVEMSGNK